jgi:internalin A
MPKDARREAALVRIRAVQNKFVLELVGLGLDDEDLAFLAPYLCQLTRLRSLQLAYNHLHQVPGVIRQLTWLEELDLSANHLEALPDWLDDLSNLQSIRVSCNRVRDLPAAIGKLSGLRRLHASNNLLDDLPSDLFQLSQLRELVLAHNEIQTLPAAIGGLHELRTLDLTGNQLASLPGNIGDLSRLTELAVGENSLSCLPEEMAKLKLLTALDLSANVLDKLPEWMQGLKKLRYLMLHHNPGLGLLPSILGPEPQKAQFSEAIASPRRILDYYFSSAGGAKRELNEARLVLVGRGYAGKTSVVKRLLDGTFQRGEPRTDGIDIRRWPPFGEETEPVLNVWDFGGQEIMHATHQFFITPNCLYLVIIHGRENVEDYDVVYWLKLIQGFAGEDAPVIVVQNKIRDYDFDLNYRELRRVYPQIIGFQKTDCHTGDGIEDLRKQIQEATRDKMPFMHSRFPAAWFDIKSEVSQMDVNYMSYSEFRATCRRHGISEPDSQDT